MNAARQRTSPALLAALVGVCLRTWARTPTESERPFEAPRHQDENGPHLAVDDAVFDWGTAYQGEEFEHAFTLRNRGNKALTVKEIKTQCGCTVIQGIQGIQGAKDELRNRTLKPGESLQVRMKVETAKFSAYTRKDADIVCEGEVQGDLKLWMQGDVKPLFAVHPSPALMEIVRDDAAFKSARLKILLVPSVDRPLALKGVEPEKKLVKVDWKEVNEVQERKAYEIDTRPAIDLKDRVAFHTETLQLAVEVAGRKVTVPLTLDLRLRDRIDVSPSRSVWFSRAETGVLRKEGAALPAKTLEIRSLAGPEHRFRIRGVRVDGGTFRASLTTVEEGRLYRLLVELVPPANGKASGRVQAKIVVETDDPEAASIVIPGSALF
jgi:hypothetical protein